MLINKLLVRIVYIELLRDARRERDPSVSMRVVYKPLQQDAEQGLSLDSEETVAGIETDLIPQKLVTRLVKFAEALENLASDTVVQHNQQVIPVIPRIGKITLWPSVNKLRAENTPKVLSWDVGFGQLTASMNRLLNTILTSVDSLAWQHFLSDLGGQTVATSKRKIFISYRTAQSEFAEAVAHRLGQEGFLPWLDRWEIHAGDSVPGKIAAGLSESCAFLPVLAGGYQQGRWCTEELETAITKRIETKELEGGYKLIPLLYERCDIPELLKPLRYVNCTDHDVNAFETQMQEVIDAVYEIELNPYRS